MTDNTANQNIEESQSEFLSFVTRMCAAHQWKITESDFEHAVIQFAVNETRSQVLFIFGFDTALEFSVPSFASFDSLENVPHIISTTLLQINAKTKIGFWCLEQIGDRLVYTFMHNTDMSGITEALFGEIVTSLIQRVEEFETLLVKMSGEENQKPE
jgi:hypothetical protein